MKKVFRFSMLTAIVAIAMVSCEKNNENGKETPDGEGIPEKASVKYLSKEVPTGAEKTFIISHDRSGDRQRVDAYGDDDGNPNMHVYIAIINHADKEYWMWNFYTGWGQFPYAMFETLPTGLQYQKGMSVEEYFTKAGYVQQGTMTVIGKECKVYVGKLVEVDGREYNTKFGIWNGLRMYQESDVDGGIIWTATALTLDVPEKAFSKETLNVDWIK